MLENYYLNKMTEDELRNYASQMNNIQTNYGLLVHSMDDMIEALDELCRIQKNMYERYKVLDNSKRVNAAFENDMFNKYTTCCKGEGVEEKN